MRRPRWAGPEATGSTTVELAWVGGLFFLLVGLVIQGAVLFYTWQALTHAAQTGARTGALCLGRSLAGCTLADVAAVACRAAVGVERARLSVEVRARGDLLQVNLRYPVPLVAPVAPVMAEGPTLSASATARRWSGAGGEAQQTFACVNQP